MGAPSASDMSKFNEWDAKTCFQDAISSPRCGAL